MATFDDVLISDGDDAPPAATIEVPTVPLKRLEGKLFRRSQRFAVYVGRSFVLDAGTLTYTSPKEAAVHISMTNVRAIKKINPGSYEIGLLMWNDQVFRLRTTTMREFDEWTEQLEAHMNMSQNTRGRSLTLKQEGAALKDVRDRHDIHQEMEHTNESSPRSTLRSRASALLGRSSGKLSSSSKSVKEETSEARGPEVPNLAIGGDSSAGSPSPPAAPNRFIERARAELARKVSGSGSKELLSPGGTNSKGLLSPRKSDDVLSPRESPRQRLGSVTAADV